MNCNKVSLSATCSRPPRKTDPGDFSFWSLGRRDRIILTKSSEEKLLRLFEGVMCIPLSGKVLDITGMECNSVYRALRRNEMGLYWSNVPLCVGIARFI